jgi:hypothetical protein
MTFRNCALLFALAALLAVSAAPAWAAPPPNSTGGYIASVNLSKHYIVIGGPPGFGGATFRYSISPATRVLIRAGGSGIFPPTNVPVTITPGTLADLRVGQFVSVQARNGHARLIEIMYFAP